MFYVLNLPVSAEIKQAYFLKEKAKIQEQIIFAQEELAQIEGNMLQANLEWQNKIGNIAPELGIEDKFLEIEKMKNLGMAMSQDLVQLEFLGMGGVEVSEGVSGIDKKPFNLGKQDKLDHEYSWPDDAHDTAIVGESYQCQQFCTDKITAFAPPHGYTPPVCIYPVFIMRNKAGELYNAMTKQDKLLLFAAAAGVASHLLIKNTTDEKSLEDQIKDNQLAMGYNQFLAAAEALAGCPTVNLDVEWDKIIHIKMVAYLGVFDEWNTDAWSKLFVEFGTAYSNGVYTNATCAPTADLTGPRNPGDLLRPNASVLKQVKQYTGDKSDYIDTSTTTGDMFGQTGEEIISTIVPWSLDDPSLADKWFWYLNAFPKSAPSDFGLVDPQFAGPDEAEDFGGYEVTNKHLRHYAWYGGPNQPYQSVPDPATAYKYKFSGGFSYSGISKHPKHNDTYWPGDLDRVFNKWFRYLMLKAFHPVAKLYENQSTLNAIIEEAGIADAKNTVEARQETYIAKQQEILDLQDTGIDQQLNKNPGIKYKMNNVSALPAVIDPNEVFNGKFSIEIPREGIIIHGNQKAEKGVIDLISSQYEDTLSDANLTGADPLETEIFEDFLKAQLERFVSSDSFLSNPDWQAFSGVFPSFIKQKTGLYDHILLDFIRDIAKSVSSSRFFDIKVLQSFIMDPSQLTQESMSLMYDNDHKESKVEGLLDVTGIKDFILEELANSECPDPTNEDLAEVDSYQKALAMGSLLMLLRLYVIEYTSKAMFSLSIYRVQDAFYDKSVIQYILKKVIEEFDTEPVSFQKETTKLVREYFNDLKKKGNVIFIDPLSPNQPLPGQPIDDTFKQEVLITDNQMLTYLVKKQLQSLATEIEQFFGTSEAQFDYVFLESWIPTYEIPAEPEEARFYQSQNQSTFYEEVGGKYDPDVGIYTFKGLQGGEPFKYSKTEYKKAALENGSFILEKYIRANT